MNSSTEKTNKEKVVNMAGWSGFTDDDLRKMRETSQKTEHAHNNIRKEAGQMRQQQKGKPMRTMPPTVKRNITETTEPAMKLSSPNKASQDVKAQPNMLKQNEFEASYIKENHASVDHAEVSKEGPEINKIYPHVTEIMELDENEALNMELGNVQKFQQRQKLIEEANKHKRALLAKAIEDRRKKAKAEAEKLMKVQQELNHLDTLLTADVSIIRDKIEAASLEYMDAQKRYQKAEKEFISAKMDLYAKGESKEHLTEHLYTIIHQNEIRKAKKLVELMEKLAMEVTPEEMELTIAAIPQLTNFTAVTTLHDPHHSRNSKEKEGGGANHNSSPGSETVSVQENESNSRDKIPADISHIGSQSENPNDMVLNTSTTPSSTDLLNNLVRPQEQNDLHHKGSLLETEISTAASIPASVLPNSGQAQSTSQTNDEISQDLETTKESNKAQEPTSTTTSQGSTAQELTHITALQADREGTKIQDNYSSEDNHDIANRGEMSPSSNPARGWTLPFA